MIEHHVTKSAFTIKFIDTTKNKRKAERYAQQSGSIRYNFWLKINKLLRNRYTSLSHAYKIFNKVKRIINANREISYILYLVMEVYKKRTCTKVVLIARYSRPLAWSEQLTPRRYETFTGKCYSHHINNPQSNFSFAIDNSYLENKSLSEF